jgi:serine/threonine-protein kinase
MAVEGALLAGRYRILGPLGAGGMATVHLAHDERLDRDAAIKVCRPPGRRPGHGLRFEREARATAAAHT